MPAPFQGQTFALVGESGSGKSTIARIVVGLLRAQAGRVAVGGSPMGDGQTLGGTVQMIFQDPYASLNPRWQIGDIIAEPIRRLGLEHRREEIDKQVAELLQRVRLDPTVRHRYPHEFSGGQRQRIAIAQALSSHPRFIVCDEPTSALDVSVQAQVLELMGNLQAEFGLTYLLISHNLAVVRQMADRVGVLKGGVLIEEGPVEENSWRLARQSSKGEIKRAREFHLAQVAHGALLVNGIHAPEEHLAFLLKALLGVLVGRALLESRLT